MSWIYLTVVFSQFASTWFLVGLIWLIQIVQYPLFSKVGQDAFVEYHLGHASRITFVVAPVMLIELLGALVMIFLSSFQPVWIFNFLLVILIWISTMWLQVPQHEVLSRGFEPTAFEFLVRSNWIRTSLWTLKGLVMIWLMIQLMNNHSSV